MSSQEPRLVLLGRQGAGKGTQSTRLAEHFGVIHVSTGDMFRTQAAQGTAFGLEAKRYMDAGDLVPDEIVVGVIEESMVPGGPLGDGFVLDGFPRTLHQARELDRVIAGSPLASRHRPRRSARDRVRSHRGPPGLRELPAGVPRQLRARRTAGRATRAAAHVRQRDDDTDEAVERRLELYERETVPIVEYYRALGLLTVVDGVGEGDEVFERLVKVCGEQLS